MSTKRKLIDLLEREQFSDLQEFVDGSGPAPVMWGCWCRRTGFLVGAIAANGGLVHVEANHVPNEAAARAELARIGGTEPAHWRAADGVAIN